MGVKLGFSLKEGHRPRVLESGVLRKIFGLETEKVKDLRKLLNDELYDCTIH
jgi:hypothetical protein